MNAERRIQRVRAALRPVGGSKPDWQILAEVARQMGQPGFGFKGPNAIWDEVRGMCDGARGMTYARLDSRGLQWPCPADDHLGTPILHSDAFANRLRASLQCIEYRPTSERTTTRYPLLLITGRSLYQFNAGTMTGRTPNTELRPEDVLDMAPADAVALAVHDGDVVRVQSRYGEAVLPARISAELGTGHLFATFQTRTAFLNRLTGSNRDGVVGTPEYKVTAVRVERVTDQSENHRSSP